MSDCDQSCDGCPRKAEHHLCDACCHEEPDAINRENRELRALLKEASAWLIADSKLNKDYVPQVMALRERIDAALEAPPADVAVTLTSAQRDDAIEVLKEAERDATAIEKIEDLLEDHDCDCLEACPQPENHVFRDCFCDCCLACRIVQILEEASYVE